MSFKKNGGFTLVELIVVIAILGLLAGIGIPQYSQYVEKANIAVDNQNLNMLHNVFVVSCVENSVDPANVTISKIIWDGTTFSGLDSVAVAGEASAAYYFRRSGGETPTSILIVNSFNDYIGSEGIQFKSKEITEADIIKGIEEGVATEGGITITPDENGNFKVSYGGGEITVNIDDLQSLKDSAFITSEGLGVNGLLNKVDEVTNFAEAMSGTNIMSGITQSEEFQKMVADALDMEYVDMATSGLALQNKLNTMADDLYNANPDKFANAEAAKQHLTSNAVVMFAAQKAADMDKNTIIDTLTAENAGANLVTNLKSDPTGTMANAALAYGMYTAYAYSKNDPTLIANTKDYTNMGTYLDDAGFKAYLTEMKGQEGNTDLDAYLSSLNMITNSVEDKNAATSLMQNGYNDPNLIKQLQDHLDALE